MNDQMVIATAVAPVYREPSFNSEMTTQGLLWEKVEIIDEVKLWFHIRQEDGYNGWIYTFYLLENLESFDYWVTLKDRFVPFTHTKDKKSGSRLLSFGTKVPVFEENNNYLIITLPGQKTGKIPIQNANNEKSRVKLCNLAKSLLGTPYIWGGKSAFGLDCSGFVQLVLSTIGISIARDTGKQVKSAWIQEINKEEAKPGDLVFFAENNLAPYSRIEIVLKITLPQI